MYHTKITKNESRDNFDWESFFTPGHLQEIIHQMDIVQMVLHLREHLKEDKFRLTFVMNRLIRSLLRDIEPNKPHILELGAATGFLTRYLLNQYGGSGVLVDKSPASFQAFNRMHDSLKKNITYRQEDIFNLELEKTFNLVCSFGLIEHFPDKEAVLGIHKKFTADNGYMLILIPLDSPLSRTFSEIHPELNLGYRELLTEKELKDLLIANGLNVLRIQASQGYVYDFVGAVCQETKKETK